MMNGLDNRGAVSAKAAVALVIAITVFSLLAALLLPVSIGAIEGDTTATLNQTTSTDYDVNGELVSTVTATTAGADATVELNDTRTSGTTSNTINEGDNATYSLDGGDVVVTVDEATAGYAVVSYEYSSDYDYSGAASSLWSVLALAIVLAALLYLIGIALSATDRL